MMAARMETRKRWSPELESPPVAVEIVDVEKRKGLSNYYLYILLVTRRNGRTYTIRRRYRQFNDVQTRLEERFPIEAGSIHSKDRTLPSLPGKIYFGRSAIRDVADTRTPQLNDFLKMLYAMPDKIRYDSIVMAFVRATSEDQKTYPGKQAYPDRHNGTVPKADVPHRATGYPPRPTISPPPRPAVSPPSRPAVSPPSRSTVTPSRPIVSPPPRPIVSPPPRLTFSSSRPAASSSHPTVSPPSRPTVSPPPRPTVSPPPRLTFSSSRPAASSSRPAASSSEAQQNKFSPPSKPTPPPKPSANGVMRGPRAKTLYPYTGQFADELSFPSDMLIALTRQVNEDWYEGSLNGHTGLVPKNYLQILQSPVTQDPIDTIQDSDEWEDSDEETGKITFYFNGAARVVEVDGSLVESPTMPGLMAAIEDQLHRRRLVLNYRDSSGDLVEMTEQMDIELMKSEGVPPRRQSDSNHAPWAVYVTEVGDYKVYSTDPHKR